MDPVIARIPKAARPNTQEGAEAFAKFFIEQVAQSFVEANPALIGDLFTDKCKTCVNFHKTAAGFKAGGEHHAKPSFVVDDTQIRQFLEGQDPKFVEVTGREVKVDILDSGGSPIDATQSRSGVRFVMAMEFDEHWVVTSVLVEQD